MVNILFIAIALTQVFADQPVHCLREKIYGEWDFHVSKDIQFINLFQTREVCTH
jgi:hypothetical protein